MKYKTKSDYVYQEIRNKINSGEYKPGRRLVPREIAEEMEISLIPVREAITKLEAEDLVTVKSHSKVKVSEISPEDMLALLQTRIILETEATAMSVPKIGERGISKLENIVELSQREGIDDEEYGSLNREFHITIYENCGNPFLYGLILNLYEKSERGKLIFKVDSHRFKDSIEEHKKIIEGIKTGNTLLAAATTYKQKSKSFNIYCKVINIDWEEPPIISSLLSSLSDS